MDFLNKSLAQVSDLFRSMTPGARLTAGLLLAVVVVSMGYLFRESASGPDAFLFGGAPLSDGELTRVEAAIAQAGLSGSQREGNRIRVPAGQQAAYLAAVADRDALPPDFNTILDNALGKGSAWDSREQARERLKIARQQTLSQIIKAMYWVENAVVLYDEQELRGMRAVAPTKQVSGSVSVKPIIGETLTAQRVRSIQKLVASAVNMQASDVTVTNLGDGGAYGSDSEMTAELFPEGSLMQTKVAFEAQKRDSIMKALRDIPGIRVEVNADFDSKLEETTTTVTPDPKAVTNHESTTEEKSSQSTADSGGAVGARSQGPNRQAISQGLQARNQSETINKTSDTDSMVGVTKKDTLNRGYMPKEVWATVTIPSSYIASLWKARNPTAEAPPKPEDLAPLKSEAEASVQEIVEPLVRLQVNKGQDQIKYARVKVLDSLPVAAIAPPTFATTATSWLGQSWNTLAMLGVAMFSLLMLRSIVKGKPGDAGDTPAASAPGLTLHTEEQPAGGHSSSTTADEPASDRPRLKLKKGSSLKDDLVDIVREDPDAAADILRAWIGKAS